MLKRRSAAAPLTQTFVERSRGHFGRAVEVFARGIEEVLTHLDSPNGHYWHTKSTNVLEMLFCKVKRRTGVVGMFPGEKNLACLATAVMLWASEDWAFGCYMDMIPLWAVEGDS